MKAESVQAGTPHLSLPHFLLSDNRKFALVALTEKGPVREHIGAPSGVSV
jgi:hypothetical protein